MSKIFFFNGWGMDKNILKPLKNIEGYEIIEINFPYTIDKSQINTDDILISWSFGVYYLNKFLSSNRDLKYKKSIAINGLPLIIGKYGINQKMFNMTLNTLSEEQLEKFLINMDIDETFNKSQKEFQSIKYELEYFKKNYIELEENFIDFYFIGVKDRIIPALKLEKFCKEKNINYKNIECGHYPFSYFKDISDIVDGEKNEI